MLTFFGSAAVTIMMVSYSLESRSKWFVLLFAAGSASTAVYSGLVQAYPVTVIEALWAVIALQRLFKRHRDEALASRQ
jgi:hypothetical protein